MSERPCNECVWRTVDGCTQWDCNPVTRKEVKKMLKERKSGKWETVWHNFFRSEVQMCSNCKGISVFKTDFCPNCGTEMKP